MKATELMIGDWVYFGKDEYSPSKIDGILPYDEGVVLDFDNEPISNDNIRPIPLTAEILEKNGFEKWSAQYRYRVLKPNTAIDKSVRFTLMIDGEHICEVRNYNATHAEPRYYNVVRYVHELQHALRLCGLVELADNFQV